MLSDTGIKQYIFVSKEGLNKSVLNTAWTMQIILPVGFGLMAYRHLVLAIRRLFTKTAHQTDGNESQ